MTNSATGASAGTLPSAPKGYFDFRFLKGDLYGGITAGIVALPLALAFGEASGAGPIAGLWGAIFTGFFAALFGGTQTQITGPTGPMVVVFAGLVGEMTNQGVLPFGEVAGVVFTAVVLAGILQILMGAFRLGETIRLVPYPVISGFMSGIGVIIILLQASRLLGSEPAGGGTIAAVQAIPGAVSDPNFAAFALGLLTLAMVFFWPKAIGRFIPGALAALIVGTLIGLLLDVPILGADLIVGLPEFVLPSVDRSTAFLVVEAAIILAVLGAIDSLLTSLVADNATRTRHDSNRELIGQGIGNSVAGLFGAIPGAGATMRTMVNIKTGGVTRLSGMVHGLLLLAVVLALAPLARQIPHAVLAGILIKVGWDIIDFAYIKRAHRGPRWDLLLMALVLLVTVFVDLITAVGIGVFLAALAFVKGVADQQLQEFGEHVVTPLTVEEEAIMKAAHGRIQVFAFDGPLSFGAAADLAHKVRDRARERTALVLDFSRAPRVDVSAARAVESIVTDATDARKAVFACGVNATVAAQLEGLGADAGLQPGWREATRLDALKLAAEVAAPDGGSPSLSPVPA
ncbi:SulP family inorganic anion transporter [Parvularcula dongshanensis]|uniref:SulP family sulfate permease n=1 Tax=Parvularcula dongshanensis TaxID=1173995 RepID=A0A840I261_9PROT|nr:SulP family inorganic anion transporter [Parvularcula dongshanensis]MBB4658324.1 SulP family sulfate permease [Parvularcula dongshanensis]